MKKILVLLMCVCLIFSAAAVFAQDNTVSVYINGVKIQADVEARIIDGRTMLPVRAVCEAIGATVTWDEAAQSITVENKDVKSVLYVGKTEAKNYIGGKEETVTLDVGAQIISGRTLVPVRYVSESMGAAVSWDEMTRSVQIELALEPTLTIGDITVTIDTDADLLDNPDRVEVGIRGLEWYVYNSDYSLYRMVAVKDGKVVGFFTNAKDFKTSFGADYMKKAEAVKLAGYSTQIYEDSENGDAVSGILCIKSDAYGEGGTASAEFFKTQAREQLDMINAFRIANGEEALLWDDYAEEAAIKHSRDMGENNYFSHTGLDGSDVVERYTRVNDVRWSAIGENIAGGHMYACESFFALLNSPGHRSNMLSPLFKYVGIGTSYNESSLYGHYTTQVFVSY